MFYFALQRKKARYFIAYLYTNFLNIDTACTLNYRA